MEKWTKLLRSGVLTEDDMNRVVASAVSMPGEPFNQVIYDELSTRYESFLGDSTFQGDSSSKGGSTSHGGDTRGYLRGLGTSRLANTVWRLV